MRFLYLSQADVAAVGLDMQTMIGLLETAFREKGHGRVEMPPKPGIHTQPDAFLHAMPAFIPAMRSAGIKWVGGYPANHNAGPSLHHGPARVERRGHRSPVRGDGLRVDHRHRTAAASALSAKYLARPESSRLGVLACGVQGRSHVEAFTTAFPIARVFAFDIRRDVQDRFVTDMRARFGVDVVGVEHPRDAVVESDLVVTSGPILEAPDADHRGRLAARRARLRARWTSTATGPARRRPSSTG